LAKGARLDKKSIPKQGLRLSQRDMADILEGTAGGRHNRGHHRLAHVSNVSNTVLVLDNPLAAFKLEGFLAVVDDLDLVNPLTTPRTKLSQARKQVEPILMNVRLTLLTAVEEAVSKWKGIIEMVTSPVVRL
jgi:hypothetical protein